MLGFPAVDLVTLQLRVHKDEGMNVYSSRRVSQEISGRSEAYTDVKKMLRGLKSCLSVTVISPICDSPGMTGRFQNKSLII